MLYYGWKIFKKFRKQAEWHKNRRGGEEDEKEMIRKTKMIAWICFINTIAFVFGAFDARDSYREHMFDESPSSSILSRLRYHSVTEPVLSFAAKYIFGKRDFVRL